MSKILSITEVAGKLGVSSRRVRAMIQEGKLVAQKVGAYYIVDEAALKTVPVYGKPGRPTKISKATKKPNKPSATARKGHPDI